MMTMIAMIVTVLGLLGQVAANWALPLARQQRTHGQAGIRP